MTPIKRNKYHPVQLRVSDQELDKLKALADAQGLSLASYIRWSLLYRDKTERGEFHPTRTPGEEEGK